MKTRFATGLWTLAVLATSYQASLAQVAITFDYSYDGGFFSGANTGRRAVLEAAASVFSDRLEDTLNAITPSGMNHFDRVFTSPSGSGTITVSDPTIPANTLVMYVGAKDLAGSTLGTGGTGGASASGTSAWLNSIVTRGESGITRQSGTLSGSSTDTDYAPWGGVLTFDSLTSWYFDSDPLTVETFTGMSDLYTVAVHELGHVLGIGQAPTWFNQINGSGQFTGSESMTLNGGSVPLNAGQDHWASGTMSTLPGTGTSQETALDPEITVGTRKYFTDLDFGALADLGWEVSPIPEPESVALAAGCLLLVGAFWTRNRRRGGTSASLPSDQGSLS